MLRFQSRNFWSVCRLNQVAWTFDLVRLETKKFTSRANVRQILPYLVKVAYSEFCFSQYTDLDMSLYKECNCFFVFSCAIKKNMYVTNYEREGSTGFC